MNFSSGAIESASAQEWLIGKVNNGKLSNPAGPLWCLDHQHNRLMAHSGLDCLNVTPESKLPFSDHSWECTLTWKPKNIGELSTHLANLSALITDTLGW